ncbi:MAG TPA: ATP synthase F0 subunit B [Candidatus Sulfotelmatobacter sp.]|nr:ATP synthase F0 subunit B [Candidatus Baltobacteraceae bacterium]HXC47225.1 ATP synthase F0 subunit B [Candidatus Sulfotelmatobacter sp.]
MSDLVHQLGELFLRAVPVAVIVLLFYVIMRSIFFQPLLKVMAERDARTIGAQKAAEAAQAAAAEKVRQYEEALRQARAKVYAEQEADRRKLMDERAAALKEARGKADAEVTAAKDRVASEFAVAKKDIQGGTSQLAAEIARRVLQAPPAPGTPTREAR